MRKVGAIWVILSILNPRSEATIGNLTTWKQNWKIGGLAIRGGKEFIEHFKPTFVDFLTERVSPLFSHPITFEIIPYNFSSIYTAVENKEVDFIFINPSIFSCMETEYGIAAILTIRSLRLNYELDKFGGVFFTRADRHDIVDLTDLKDKILEGEELSSLSGSKMQWESMLLNNMSYMNDPAQLRFSHSQNSTVFDVSDGKVDVGLIRTDVLESLHIQGKIDISNFKIIHQVNVSDEHYSFPFVVSTDLYPEWPFAVLEHTDWHVSQQVVESLMHIDRFMNASIIGGYATWQAPLSYVSLRDLHEDLKWIVVDKGTHLHRCRRSYELYDSIHCPDGWVKKSKSEVDNYCKELESKDPKYHCPEGYDCVCHPCYPIAVDITERTDNSIYFYCVFAMLPVMSIGFYIIIKRNGKFFAQMFAKYATESLLITLSVVFNVIDFFTDIYSFQYVVTHPQFEDLKIPYLAFLVIGGLMSVTEIYFESSLLISICLGTRDRFEKAIADMQAVSNQEIKFENGKTVNLRNKRAVKRLCASARRGVISNVVSLGVALLEDTPFMVMNALIIMEAKSVDAVLIISMLLNAFYSGTIIAIIKSLLSSLALLKRFNAALEFAVSRYGSTYGGENVPSIIEVISVKSKKRGRSRLGSFAEPTKLGLRYPLGDQKMKNTYGAPCNGKPSPIKTFRHPNTPFEPSNPVNSRDPLVIGAVESKAENKERSQLILKVRMPEAERKPRRESTKKSIVENKERSRLILKRDPAIPAKNEKKPQMEIKHEKRMSSSKKILNHRRSLAQRPRRPSSPRDPDDKKTQDDPTGYTPKV
ncbi:hypothetical protein AAMO2058_000864500 [Amorphochlora amoebiformis]